MLRPRAMLNALRRITLPRVAITAPAVLVLAAVVFLALLQVPDTPDWRATFYPAAQNWTDPYRAGIHFVYPPWLAVLLAPFSLLSPLAGRALFGAVSVCCLALALRRLGGDLYTLCLILISPMFVSIAVNGQVDAWPVLGLALGLDVGIGAQVVALLLLLLKPQLFGLAIVVIWLKSNHKRKLMLWTAGIGLASLAAYGWWPAAVAAKLPQLYRGVDVSLWPYGWPVGLLVLGLALRKRSVLLAGVATFFWVPYINWYSLIGFYALALARLPRLASTALVLLTWWAFRFYAIELLAAGNLR